MLSCWSTWWQPPQKNTSLLNHGKRWLNPKLVLSSRTEFLAWLCTCSCCICHSLMQGWHKVKWESSSNKHEMEITEWQNIQTIEEWQDKRWLEATAKGNKDLFPALKYSEQNQLIKLYFIPWKDTFLKCISCVQNVLYTDSVISLHLVSFYRTSSVASLYVLVGRKIWLGINTVLLHWLLKSPQNMMWLSRCPLSHQ